MKVDLGKQVLEYFSERNQSELTIELEEIPSNCCLGRLPELKLLDTLPSDPDQYRHFSVHGIRIHVSRVLRTQDTLKVFLSGFGPFKNLEVSGVNLIL